MFSFYMKVKIARCGSLMTTDVTSVADAFMNKLDMRV